MQTNKKPGRDAAGYASCTGNVRRVVLPVLMVFGLTACSASLPDFSTTNISMLGGFTKEEEKADAGYEVVLAKQAAALNPRSPVEATIRDILELAEQKRFTEARNVLAELRESQPRRSDGYRASTATMALLALKAGDFPMFRRLARQLDKSLGAPLRVDPGYVEVISLYRAAVGKSLPVNAPDGIKKLAAKYFDGPAVKSRKETNT
mgnify:CR=1 FL=1